MTGFQVMPALSDDEYRALEQSIQDHGVQVPIMVTTDGRIVDGHHRAEIADRLDRHCPRVTAEGDDTELRTLAFELNNHRRQQSREARRGQVRKSLRADPQLSNREHARRTGVDDKTVATIRKDMEATAEIPQSETRVSADGRTRPATQPRPEPVAPLADPAPPFDPTAPWDSEQVTARAIQSATALPPFNPETGELLDDGMDGKTYTRPEPKPASAPRPVDPKKGTDLYALRNVVVPALEAWSDSWTDKTLLDDTVTAEEAAQILRDLSRATPVLAQIRRLLNTRLEHTK